MFSASVDASGLLSLFDRMGPSMDFLARQVALDTAKRIVREAQARVKRATGTTAEGIHFEVSYDGAGYVVLGYAKGNNDAPVDRFLESGTMHMYARPFFFVSAELESGPHMRRLIEKMQDWLDQVGR
jgi:hypothetical protein